MTVTLTVQPPSAQLPSVQPSSFRSNVAASGASGRGAVADFGRTLAARTPATPSAAPVATGQAPVMRADPRPATAAAATPAASSDSGRIVPAADPTPDPILPLKVPTGARTAMAQAEDTDPPVADAAPGQTDNPAPTPPLDTAALVAAMAGGIAPLAKAAGHAATAATGSDTGTAMTRPATTGAKAPARPAATVAAHGLDVASAATTAGGRTAPLPDQAPDTGPDKTAAAPHAKAAATTPDAARDTADADNGNRDSAPPAVPPAVPSAGPAQPAMAVAHSAVLTTMPAAPSTSAAERPTDFATLVDSIARARSDSAAGGATAPIGVTMQHGDFGRVSLSFSTRDDGLSVTMASADPGFAPAVAAAADSHAANRQSGAHQDNSQNGGQSPPSQSPPSQSAPFESHNASQSGGQMGSGTDSGASGEGGRPSAGRDFAGRPAAIASPASAGAADPADDAGIFA